MKRQDYRVSGGAAAERETMIPRRKAIAFSVLALLGVPAARALGRESAREAENFGPPKEILERIEQTRIFSERMRNASGMEERAKIMEERNAWERSRAVERIKDELGLSDEEWAVVKPRVEAVYSLVHPQGQMFGRGDASSLSPSEQRRRELRELLANKEAKPEEIKTKLIAFRSAKEDERQQLVKARQSLRQLMTIRQEALLVLNGLLD